MYSRERLRKVIDFLKSHNEDLKTNDDLAKALHLKSKTYISDLISDKENAKPINDVIVNKLKVYLHINPAYLEEKSPQMFSSQNDQSPKEYAENVRISRISEDEHPLTEINLSQQVERLTGLVKQLQKDLKTVEQRQAKTAVFQARVNDELLKFLALEQKVSFEDLRKAVYSKEPLTKHPAQNAMDSVDADK